MVHLGKRSTFVEIQWFQKRNDVKMIMVDVPHLISNVLMWEKHCLATIWSMKIMKIMDVVSSTAIKPYKSCTFLRFHPLGPTLGSKPPWPHCENVRWPGQTQLEFIDVYWLGFYISNDIYVYIYMYNMRVCLNMCILLRKGWQIVIWMHADSCLVFQTMTCLSSLKPCILSFLLWNRS